MAHAAACCPVADPLNGDAVDEDVYMRDSTSGSVGCKSFRRTNPDGDNFTGTYLLSSRNSMNFEHEPPSLGWSKFQKMPHAPPSSLKGYEPANKYSKKHIIITKDKQKFDALAHGHNKQPILTRTAYRTKTDLNFQWIF